jgi:hypothetical protein
LTQLTRRIRKKINLCLRPAQISVWEVL